MYASGKIAASEVWAFKAVVHFRQAVVSAKRVRPKTMDPSKPETFMHLSRSITPIYGRGLEIGAVWALPAGLRSPVARGAGRALAYLCGVVRVRAYDIDCGAGAGPRAVSYCGPLRACIAYMRSNAVQCLILLSIL